MAIASPLDIGQEGPAHFTRIDRLSLLSASAHVDLEESLFGGPQSGVWPAAVDPTALTP